MVLPTIITNPAENSSFDIPSPEINSTELKGRFTYLE